MAAFTITHDRFSLKKNSLQLPTKLGNCIKKKKMKKHTRKNNCVIQNGFESSICYLKIKKKKKRKKQTKITVLLTSNYLRSPALGGSTIAIGL